MLNLTSSEDFSNVAATGRASFDQSGAQSGSGNLSSATFHYDANAATYTLTTGGRSQSFGPSNLDAAQSNSATIVYSKTSGSVTDSLTLTRPGTSGRFTYQYVGGAFLQHTDIGATTITGSLDALAYGVATPDANVPRSGRAEYSVDLTGIEFTNGTIAGIAGSGVSQVDFARGVLVTHGTSGALLAGSTTFSSEARLSNARNSFSGTFRFDDLGAFRGELQGQFFGPAAQEIGGAFYASGGSDRVVVGAILGRGDAVHTANTSLKTLTVNDFFSADASILAADLPGASGMNNSGPGFSSTDAQSDALIVNYDASSQDYSVISPSRSQYFLGIPSVSGTNESFTSTTPLNTLTSFSYPTFTNLEYVATKEWFKVDSGRYTIESFVYGIPTLDNALPRTGSGDYAIGLSGRAADDAFVNLTNITGFGFLNADFASGTLTTSGQVLYTEDYVLSGRPRGSATGNFSGSATISSTTNSFTGPINFTGLGNYSGLMHGRFFGPAAQEVGAAFTAEDGAGGALAGTFAGGLDSAASQQAPTLASLSGPTSFSFVAVHDAPSGAYTNDLISIAYDPQSSTYSLSLTDTHLSGAPIQTLSLTSTNRDSAASNASYDVYTTSLNGAPYLAHLLRAAPTNPTLALRYTSLVQLTGTLQTSPPLPSDRYYIAFGLPTSTLRMPIGGTATYNGIALGTGSMSAFPGGATPSVTTFYNLAGATSMIVNFAAGTFQSTLNLTGSDIASAATHTFPTLNFAGDISGNTYSTHNATATYTGGFFGPNAEEVGGTFATTQSDANGTLTNLQGAVVGAR